MGAGSRGIDLLKWMIVCTVVCAILLLLRFWSSRIQKRKAYADDWMVLIAFASVVSLDGVGIWAIFNGLGKHSNELSLQELGVMQKLILASDVCWLVGTVFNKLSVLWLYRRVFKTPVFLKWSMGVFIVVVAFGISFFIVFMTQCHPMSYIWHPVPGGSCRNLTYQEYASVSANMAIDLAIFILPLPVLWTLQMTTRNKFYVTIMLSFGLITIAVMAWRIQATYVSEKNPDFVYSLATIGLISGLELWLGILVACMPTILPVIQTYVRPAFDRLTSYYYSRRGSSRNKRGDSDKPIPSDDIQLYSNGQEAFRGVPDASGSSLSTEVSSFGRTQNTKYHGVPGCGMRGIHDNNNDNPYVTINDEGHDGWTARYGDTQHINPQNQTNFGHFQDEEAGRSGILIQREFRQQEKYKRGLEL